MGSLTLVETSGQTLEQALDQVLAGSHPGAGRDQLAAAAHDPACLVCGGSTAAIPLRGGRTLVACRDCRSTIETAPPARATLRLAS
jgi:hypothetical protein